MNTQETPEALAFFKASQRVMEVLWERWQDEGRYEDINEYAKPLQPIANKAGVKIVKMTKRPFGCIFAVGEKQFALTCNSRAYEYKRIK